MNPEKAKVYIHVAKLCMDLNYFVFRGAFYRVSNDTSMGNPASPFMAECCMSNLERQFRERSLLPRMWVRYVDDIFAVIKISQADIY